MIVLPGHRAEPAHLPEQPFQRRSAPTQIFRDEFAGLLREIDEDCAGFEDRDRLAAVGGLVVDNCRDSVIRRDAKKVCLELFALADIDRNNSASSRKIVTLWPFGVVQ
jgi:hypothetical protein